MGRRQDHATHRHLLHPGGCPVVRGTSVSARLDEPLHVTGHEAEPRKRRRPTPPVCVAPCERESELRVVDLGVEQRGACLELPPTVRSHWGLSPDRTGQSGMRCHVSGARNVSSRTITREVLFRSSRPAARPASRKPARSTRLGARRWRSAVAPATMWKAAGDPRERSGARRACHCP